VPTKRQADDWVDALRVFSKDTLGNKNWQWLNPLVSIELQN